MISQERARSRMSSTSSFANTFFAEVVEKSYLLLNEIMQRFMEQGGLKDNKVSRYGQPSNFFCERVTSM